VDFDGRFTFGQYDEVLVFDHTTDEWWAAGSIGERVLALPEPAVEEVALDFSTEWKEKAYLQAVTQALDYIAAGDIYQVNLAHSWQSPWPRHTAALGFYEKLRAFSPAPYAAYLQMGERQMLSVSPELFLKMDGQQVMTRPIKGTRPRYRDPDEDERSAYELMTSAKEIAELVMITDLERNDLGQVCEYGSVRVSELLKMERYAQVFHLVSTVEGTMRAELDHFDVLRACFPGGSISGAPKKRALEIIDELEPTAREWYTGAIGYLGAHDDSQFNIAIRTAVVKDETIRFFTGSGIVADSEAAREYEETWHKASSLLGAAKWLQAEPKKEAEPEAPPMIHPA
jgi:anthranilate/para-aminobenzoate synthase component I